MEHDKSESTLQPSGMSLGARMWDLACLGAMEAWPGLGSGEQPSQSC